MTRNEIGRRFQMKNSTIAQHGQHHSVDRTFAYNALDAKSRSFIQRKTGEIREHIGRAAQGIIEVGNRLLEVKAALKHGEFTAWLHSEFDWSDRTARRMMQVAEEFKTVTVSDLSAGPKALYLLAAPSTPRSVKDEIKPQVLAGERVTHAQVKDAIAKSKASNVAAGEPTRVSVRRAPTVDDQQPPADPVPGRTDITVALANGKRLLATFQLFKSIVEVVNEIAGDGDKRKPLPGGARIAHEFQNFRRELSNARETLKACAPVAVCCYCKGASPRCSACKGEGVLPQSSIDAAPRELKGVNHAA